MELQGFAVETAKIVTALPGMSNGRKVLAIWRIYSRFSVCAMGNTEMLPLLDMMIESRTPKIPNVTPVALNPNATFQKEFWSWKCH